MFRGVFFSQKPGAVNGTEPLVDLEKSIYLQYINYFSKAQLKAERGEIV